MTNPKIKQRELPLCSTVEYSEVKRTGGRHSDAFVISHPAGHVYVTQRAERLSAVGPSALSEVTPVLLNIPATANPPTPP